MSDTRPTVSSRDRKVAEMIRDRKGFKTYGSFSAQSTLDAGLGNWDSGKLYGEDLESFREQCRLIDYVVYSYSTPIAWYSQEYGWYVARGKWSLTTSHHQGKLYLIPQPTLDI